MLNNLVPIKTLLLLWLAHGVSVLLHFPRLSWWYALIWLFIVFWHRQVIAGRWFLPGRLAKLAIVLASCALLIISNRYWFNLEPLVGLLLLAFILKLLELKTHRDGTVLLFLSYMVTACHFLFEQSLMASLLGIATLLLSTWVLIEWQSERFYLLTDTRESVSSSSLKKLFGILLLTLPFMLILFLLIPRIGNLWSVPLRSNQAYVGMSDTMSPGDISQLSQRDELAFRVTFLNDIVPSADRYWRGLVLSDFDGRTWRRHSELLGANLQLNRLPEVMNVSPNDYHYRIMQEPTGKPWLYGLPVVKAVERSSIRTQAHEVISKDVEQRIQYELVSNVGTVRDQATAYELRQALLLPKGFNPKTLQWAQALRQDSSNSQDFIQQVLSYYRDNFTYTLSPPALGDHSIDDFLMVTQRGFCEHFASSFVVAMRAVGIPAQVVVGYQGGKWNSDEGYLRVSQNDAHAWAEVWLEQEGWVRVDPTAAVAPNRIERGLFEALDDTDQQQLGYYYQAAWLATLKTEWDSINYRWQNWVMGFDKSSQQDMLNRWLGHVSILKIALVLLTACGLLLLSYVGIKYLKSRSAISYEQRVYQRYIAKLARLDRGIHSGMSLETIERRISGIDEISPSKLTLISNINLAFSHWLYASEHSNTDFSKSQQSGNSQEKRHTRRELKRTIHTLLKEL